MKQNLLRSEHWIIILITIFSLVCSCSQLSPYYTYEQYDDMEHTIRSMYGMKKGYQIDSIPYDTAKFMLIGNPGLHKYFYLPKCFLKTNRKINDKKIFRDNYALWNFKFASWHNERYYGYYREDEGTRGEVIRSPYNDSGWYYYRFANPPIYLRVYIIRGVDFNEMYCNSFHITFAPYDFPDKYAYYKVVVPVFNK